ncbi:MAG: family 16 glycosylhydrolase [Bacteroidales bacterium]|nr:family 16 glycosylhydrolase [Bacteroidales bacterium]
MNIKGLLLLCAATLFTQSCGGKPTDDPVKATLSVTPSAINVSYEATTEVLSVTATGDWGVSAADKSWCSVSPSGGIKGTSSVKVKLDANRTGEVRENSITFVYGSETLTVPVRQDLNEEDVPKPTPEMVIPDGYVLDWNDEFDQEDGSSPDTRLWRFENKPAGWVNHELQTYAGIGRNGVKTAFIEGGALNIRASKEGKDIISARMYSQKSWTYGYMEAAIWLPKGKGTWPAFWMMPDDFSRGWPGCGEIDIMEEVGYHANYTSSSIHCMKYYHSIGTQKTHEQYTAGAEDGYHVYAVEWTPDALVFYVDGKRHFTFNNDKAGNDDTWPFNKNFYLILNLAWGGDWGGSQGVDETALPCTMKVDYVRVFKKK